MPHMRFLTPVIIVLCLIGLLAGLVGTWWVYTGLQPVVISKGVQPEDQRFVVARGEGVASIATRLESEGLITNALVFRALTRYQGIESSLQAGSFMLNPTQRPAEIAQQLTEGTEDVWITLPEGLRREEIAERLDAYELESFDPDEFLRLTSGLEGQLFPDTYLVPRMIRTEAVVDLLTQTFQQKIDTLTFPDEAEEGLTPDEYLTLASLVQREAQTMMDMALVAGILKNRLEIGMPLQVDATLQYAKGFSQTYNRWWGYPVPEDKGIVSPFNTYQVATLPPAPICNPGLQALMATINHEETEMLYYLHAPDGSMYYAATLEEHNRNVDTYLR